MSAQHTPGPWTVGDENGHNANFVFGPDGLVCSVFGIAIHRHIDDLTQRDASGLANARLIAAAPELLEALELCIPERVCLTNKNIPDSTIVPLDVPMGDLRRIATAIAKARGQA